DDIRYYMKDHLGSVRAVTDGSGSVISSQDYDAWGYLLEDRVYGSDESVYKFTGKERDDESEYDYFGARYYDARVGRWGQVEPLLDKYISWSPYQYSFVNPIKMKDVNGKDAKVTIEGTKITIDVKIFFSMDNVSSSGTFKDEYSQNLFSNYLQEAQNQWQDAFSQVSRYDIEFNIIPEFVSIEELNDINSKLQTGELNSGENVADYKDEKEPGVNLNYLRIVPMEGKSSPPYTGSHEIGHLIGFEHPYKKTSSMQKKSKNIMGYSHDRDMPTKYDALRFLNKLDLSKNIQIIKGAKDAN
ncbi:MAG TPA: RHS repeat-associated core domain-containing protein, partial [Ignavibacteria bacterium]|nr:RHS repeat-associated core domain-containing protein [Ignavibacteria bacterium]HMR41993.1 RHS repeat-associated core domain-containing protein [Ignavibacteria bacterium]